MIEKDAITCSLGIRLMLECLMRFIPYLKQQTD